jgi:hypothetical protein
MARRIQPIRPDLPRTVDWEYDGCCNLLKGIVTQAQRDARRGRNPYVRAEADDWLLWAQRELAPLCDCDGY